MTQLAYMVNAPVAQPGMVFDGPAGGGNDIVSVVAGVNIPFGSYCGNIGGAAFPVQDATTAGAFATALAISQLGVAVFDPLGVEQNYTTWQVPTTLAATAAVTAGSKAVTLSAATTLPQGAQISFASQGGAIYTLAAALVAGTAVTLTSPYLGVTNAATAVTQYGTGSQASGWLKGMMVPLMRRGRIWAAWDGGGTVTRGGPVNLRHSSTGANPQGIFTFTAAQTTVGNEIDIAPNMSVWNPSLVGGTAGPGSNDPFGNAFAVIAVQVTIG